MMAAVLVLGLGSASGVLTPQSAPSFAGVWERDPDRSDDSEEKMRAALQEMQEQMERRRGGPVPGGPGPGGPENRSRGGAEVGQVPEELQIELEKGELRMDDGERLRIYYLDGQKHRREMPNGVKLETVALRQGDSILIEEKLERGKIDRKLDLSADGETMVMTWTIEMRSLKDSVVIRTVYERIE